MKKFISKERRALVCKSEGMQMFAKGASKNFCGKNRRLTNVKAASSEKVCTDPFRAKAKSLAVLSAAALIKDTQKKSQIFFEKV